MKRLAAFAVAVLCLLPVAASAAPNKTEYRYRWDATRMVATYTCDDGTIVPGPHPVAQWDAGGSFTLSASAHSVEKLDAYLRAQWGLGLTDKAKAFLYALLPTITC